MATLEDSKKLSSVTLSVEYMQKTMNKIYANLTVGIPLPIYKTENINSLKAKLSTNETNNRLNSSIHSLDIQTDITLNSLNRSAKNYKLIQKEIIPLKQKSNKI